MFLAQIRVTLIICFLLSLNFKFLMRVRIKFIFTRDFTRYHDACKILGIDKSSSHINIKKSYKELAQKWHPDKNPENKFEAESKIKEINLAYEYLKLQLKPKVKFKASHRPQGCDNSSKENKKSEDTRFVGDFSEKEKEHLFKGYKRYLKEEAIIRDKYKEEIELERENNNNLNQKKEISKNLKKIIFEILKHKFEWFRRKHFKMSILKIFNR